MKQKGFAPILIILVLIALAVVGYFGYKNYWPKLQTYIKPSPVASQAPNGDLANWKTYINKKFNFQLGYPDNWSIEEAKTDLWSNDVGDRVIVLSMWPSSNKSHGTPASENEVFIGIAKVKSSTNLETWVKAQSDTTLPNKYYSQTQINGNMAVKKDILITQDFINSFYKGPAGPAPIGQRNISIYIKNSDLITTFTAISTKNSSDFFATFDQILSTFKFLGSTPTATCKPSPVCLDATPKCLIPETSDICPPSPTP